MPPHRFATIRLLDFLRGRIALDTEHLVRVWGVCVCDYRLRSW
jgi:hypothetical protein